jgi:hypothetical protein
MAGQSGRFGAGLARRILGGIAMAAVVTPAFADCYDLLGCTDRDNFAAHYYSYLVAGDGPTCDFLWVMRNSMYKEHGYCFRTQRGIQEMGNEGCRTSNTAALGLSRIETANIATIQRAERAKHCPA